MIGLWLVLQLGAVAGPAAGAYAETIVVSAARTEQALGEVPATLSIVNRSEIIAAPAVAVDGVLRQVPGFALQQFGDIVAGDATVQAVSMRGTGTGSSSRTLVLLDGVPLIDPFGGWISWGRVPLETVERIEVVRSGGAAAWGNLALGGVVHMITRPVERRQLDLSAQAGNLQTVRLEARAAERLGAYGLDAAAAFLDTDGYTELRRDFRGAVDVETRTAQRNWRAGLTRDFASGAHFQVGADAWSEKRREGTPLSPGEAEAVLLRAGGQLGRGGLWRWAGFAQETKLTSLRSTVAADRNSEVPSLDQFDVPARGVGGSLEWVRGGASPHQLGAGGDLSWADGSTNEDFDWVAGAFTRRRHAGGEQRLAGIFVQDNWRAGGRWSVAGASRLDYWRTTDGLRIETDPRTGAELSSREYPDRRGTVFTPSLGAVYALAPRAALRGSVFGGFRAPNLNELHRPFRTGANVINEANPELVPERLEGAEIGLDLRGRTLQATLAGYWNEIDDPIVNRTVGEAGASGAFIPPCGAVGPRGACRQRDNFGHLRSRGVEVEARARIGAWRAVGTYVFQDHIVTSAPGLPAVEGKRLRWTPEHQASARLEVEPLGGFDLLIGGRYVSERPDDDENTRFARSFFVVEAHAAMAVNDRWTTFLSVENLLDREVELQRGRSRVDLGPPLQARLGVRYRWVGRAAR